MARAQQRDASRQGRFYFRKNVYPPGSSAASSGSSSPCECNPKKRDKKLRNCFEAAAPPEDAFIAVNGHAVEEEFVEMSMDEIINGKVGSSSLKRRGRGMRKLTAFLQGPEFPGLLGLINAYLDTLDIEPQEMAKIQQYLGLIRRRADGELE